MTSREISVAELSVYGSALIWERHDIGLNTCVDSISAVNLEDISIGGQIDMNSYSVALKSFVEKHRKTIAFLFSTADDDLSVHDLKAMLEHVIGAQLQTTFEYWGGFGVETLQELQRIPREHRSHQVARKALERAEFQHVQNRPLRSVVPATLGRNPLADHLDQWLKNRVRKELKVLAEATLEIERKTRRLVQALEKFRANPSPVNRRLVAAEVKGLNRALTKMHARARVAGAWAIRAGYHSAAAAQALDHLYFKRAQRLESSTMKLDTWLAQNGFNVRVSAGIGRRSQILFEELPSGAGQTLTGLPRKRGALVTGSEGYGYDQ